MTNTVERHQCVSFLAMLALLLALVTCMTESQERPALPEASANLDRFLLSVRSATPPTAHLLVAANPSVLVFQRATYWLYPRVLAAAPTPDRPSPGVATSLSWRDLRAVARRSGARYVLLWGLPLHPRAKVRVRISAGALVEVPA